MQVRVLPFGVLKEWLGSSASTIELPDGATVADLLRRLADGQAAPSLRGIAVSVNADIATSAQALHDGDEVGLLPPVSGGAGQPAAAPEAPATAPDKIDEFQSSAIALTREAIDAARLIAAAKQGEDGAVVVFDGIVRNNSRGRQTLHLDYEAYEQMALKQMNALAHEARTRFAVRQVTMVHRLGRLQVGETSILIVVASAHRAEAFEASRWLIDTLKKTVPIWKKETFVDGAVWAAGEPFPAGMAIAPPEASHEQ